MQNNQPFNDLPPSHPVLTSTGGVSADTFARVGDDGALPAGDVLLTVAQLDLIGQVSGKKGVLLTATDSPETLVLPLAELDLIAIEFAAFADGRGYSFAALLRRQGFTGELRAVGDVFKDVLFYLKRCGFNSFVLKAGKDVEVAKAGLNDFSAGYQIATATPNSHYQTGR